MIKNNNTYIDKYLYLSNVIEHDVINIEERKILNTIELLDYNEAISSLYNINSLINKNINNSNVSVYKDITSKIINIIKEYGTKNISDMINICFSKIKLNNQYETDKLDILTKYFTPHRFKIISKKNEKQTVLFNKDCSNNINICLEENNMLYENLNCIDCDIKKDNLYVKVQSMSVYITDNKNTYLVYGLVKNIYVDIVNNNYISNLINDIIKNKPNDDIFNKESFKVYLKCIQIKDMLINNNVEYYYDNYKKKYEENNRLNKKVTSDIVKTFMNSDTYNKRNILIQMLIFSDNYQNKYLVYLLYDLLSQEKNNEIDSVEQIEIYNSLPWVLKESFNNTMLDTIMYTKKLNNFDYNKVPLEQQICLMKTTDEVKEKALFKLKEIKNKSEDSGSKVRQYIDGLLKIPFGIYKREYILSIMGNIKLQFKSLVIKYNNNYKESTIPLNETYTNLEIKKYIQNMDVVSYEMNEINKIILQIDNSNKDELLFYIKKNIVELNNNNNNNVKIIGELKYKSLSKISKNNLIRLYQDFINKYKSDDTIRNIIINTFNNYSLKNDLNTINNDFDFIKNFMANIKITLNSSIHGHEKAKLNIERIIAQWINGDLNGYCFGFEGPPGVGKTSLAKRGLSNCLKDENNIGRPFAMIQMGGDSNGSSLHGHNYTYVGSTWGSIVQILMDKKCMNPIIFIDEIDKISKTEQGKEIIGILTHLLDSTQNDCFQDKYFNGIDLDLSKALFILSYNDPALVDSILLDRIHRVKFDSLSLKDKLIICKDYILPEHLKKIGLTNMIIFNDDVLKFIIDNYTFESGVRKLKEILFDIIGDINLTILKDYSVQYDIPINITIDDIKNVYLRDKHIIKEKTIHSEDSVGIINGLWANSLGKGGIIPIQCKWKPNPRFLGLDLTGTQGNVMKESMNVAITLAWELTDTQTQNNIMKKYSNKSNIYGIHIHCPDTSTPKDGPSAGTAITVVLYSIINNKKIKKNVAITGEICLSGNVTAIGGLDLKILGAIKAGVTEIIYPTENHKDFSLFMDKYSNDKIIDNILFYPVNTIYEVIKLVFV